jgi:hypothetical protein
MTLPLEIQQTLWLETPKGKALAKFLIDRGDEGDLQWVCFQDNGEIWTWCNKDVRATSNVTMGRSKPAA